MKLPIKIYASELTTREWLPSDTNMNKCYILEIEYPDPNLNYGKFICSMTEQKLKIKYYNIETDKYLDDLKIIELLQHLNAK